MTTALGVGLRDDASVSDFRIVVLASGSGTNLQAILDRLHGREGIEVVGVGSDKPDARALERARSVEVATGVFPRGDYPDREARDAAMGDWIEARGADLVVLAGYMQLLSRGLHRPLSQPGGQHPPGPVARLPGA